MNASLSSSPDLTAFCETCPLPENVSAFLETLGFRLSFEMGAVTPPAYEQLPTLPAQFHYVDAAGAEVIFLAGFDNPLEDGVQYPVHASRFWVCPGNDGGRFALILRALAREWSLRWQCSDLVDKPSPAQRDIA